MSKYYVEMKPSRRIWFNVFVNILSGVLGGACLGMALYFPIRTFLSNFYEGYSLKLIQEPSFLICLFVPLLGVLGASGGFLGKYLGRQSRLRNYIVLIGLISGITLVLLWRAASVNSVFSIFVLIVIFIGGGAGLAVNLLRLAIEQEWLFGSLIVALATCLTILSLVYVQPKNCAYTGGTSGTCQAREQRAGWPLAVFRDHATGGSPLSGTAVLGPEDFPNPVNFVLNILFYSLILWSSWRAWLTIMTRIRLPRQLT